MIRDAASPRMISHIERGGELLSAATVKFTVAAGVNVATASAAVAGLLLLPRARVQPGSVPNGVHVSAPRVMMRAQLHVHDWGLAGVCWRLAPVSGCKGGSPSRQRALAGRPGSCGGERGRCRRSGT